MTVADTRGPLQLTVPIAKPESRSTARWCDIRVSDHGDWWAVHRTALESAYGRTPYFEFYIDSLLPLMEPRRQAANEPVTDLCRMANDVILSLLGIDTQVHYRTDPDEPLPADAIDLRSADISTLLPEVTYWQVRAEKLGFIGGLSVLDLIFNMGTEAPLILSERIKSPEFVKNLEARHMAATL